MILDEITTKWSLVVMSPQPSIYWRNKEQYLAFSGQVCVLCGAPSLAKRAVCATCGSNLSENLPIMTGVMAVPFYQENAFIFPAQPEENNRKIERVLTLDNNSGKLIRGEFGPVDGQEHEFVSGGVKVGESARGAMVREIREEVGALVKNLLFESDEGSQAVLAEFERVFAFLALSDPEELPNFFVAQWLLGEDGTRKLRAVFRVEIFKWLLSDEQYSFLDRNGLVFSLLELVKKSQMRARPSVNAFINSSFGLPTNITQPAGALEERQRFPVQQQINKG